jgi:hypothetical protein
MTISFANCNSCLLLHGIASTFCLVMTSVLRRITSTDKSPSRNDEKDRHCVLVPSIVITEEETCLRRGDLRFANCNSCLLLHEIASTFCLAMTSVLRRITSTDKSPSRNDEKDRHCVLVPSIVITRREATW